VQGGEFQAVPFDEIADPATGRGRLRAVDVETESYQVALDYMVRIGPKDFRYKDWIEKLAEAGGLSEAEFLTRFGKFSSETK